MNCHEFTSSILAMKSGESLWLFKPRNDKVEVEAFFAKDCLNKNLNKVYSIELELTPRFNIKASPTKAKTNQGQFKLTQETGGKSQKAVSTIAKTDKDIIPQNEPLKKQSEEILQVVEPISQNFPKIDEAKKVQDLPKSEEKQKLSEDLNTPDFSFKKYEDEFSKNDKDYQAKKREFAILRGSDECENLIKDASETNEKYGEKYFKLKKGIRANR